MCQALDLDIHLKRGDAIARARDLEVHIAQRILDALDVGQDRELAFSGHKAHRNARDGRLDRHTGVHQRKRRAAHRRHRGRAVGAQDLGHQADRVWPLFNRRDDREERPLRKRAVTDLAATRPALGPRLTHRVGGKVVVVHEALELFGGEAVELLLVGHRSECRDGQRLRLTAGEKS